MCVGVRPLLLLFFFCRGGRLADHHSFLLFIISGRIIFKSTEHTDRDTVR